MNNLRKDFPIFGDNKLVYCDSAATSQKPQQVIDALVDFYSYHNAPVHRGIYTLAEEATERYEAVRRQVAKFIGAPSATEIVFTKGATESINLVAESWAAYNLQAGDEIVLSQLEHHANIVPWQKIAQTHGVILRWIPILPDGTLNLSDLSTIINQKTKLVAITQSSNALGTQVDLVPIIKQARVVGARVLVDAAQSVPHQKVDVLALDCDFLVFSGHKMLGPTGVGVLYIKKDLHDSVQPYQRGGSMVFDVSFERATWRQMPHMLEAGTPPIAQVIGLGAAINYLEQYVDFNQLQKHEALLCEQLIDGLQQIPKITILGPLNQLKKSGHLVSFIVNDIHAHDIAAYLNTYSICVRAGHHCAQPLHTALKCESSVRASFYVYNTQQEVESIVNALKKLLL